jgi:gas vesicle protein
MSNIPSYQGTSNQKAPGAASSLTGEASALAQGLKDQVTDATRHITGQAAELADSAKSLASDAGEKLRDTIEEQKTAGADYVSGVASAVRRAAGEFDKELPQAAQYIRRAAEQMDGVSDALRRRDLNQLMGGVQDFARRQPTAFLGAAVLAGFAVVRFLKSSTATSSGAQESGSAVSGGSRPDMLHRTSPQPGGYASAGAASEPRGAGPSPGPRGASSAPNWPPGAQRY